MGNREDLDLSLFLMLKKLLELWKNLERSLTEEKLFVIWRLRCVNMKLVDSVVRSRHDLIDDSADRTVRTMVTGDSGDRAGSGDVTVVIVVIST